MEILNKEPSEYSNDFIKKRLDYYKHNPKLENIFYKIYNDPKHSSINKIRLANFLFEQISYMNIGPYFGFQENNDATTIELIEKDINDKINKDKYGVVSLDFFNYFNYFNKNKVNKANNTYNFLNHCF